MYLSRLRTFNKLRNKNKQNYWHQPFLSKLDHGFPTVARSRKPMKLNVQSKKIILNIKKSNKRNKPDH
jgi:hypothetical protein